MPNGTVKWFNKKIGAGFIKTDDGESVSFFNNSIQGSDISMIRKGARVCMEVQKSQYGLTATNVRTSEMLDEAS
jgi:cold shock CspA family protein